jgi:hypothetical protein
MIKTLLNKIKNNIIVRFIVYLKITLTIIFLSSYITNIDFKMFESIVLSISISISLMMLQINSIIKKNDELTKNNYWKLKNELQYLNKIIRNEKKNKKKS